MAMVGRTVGTFALGAGAVAAAPYLTPLLRAVGRPLLRTALKQGHLLFEASAERLTRLREELEDLVAEVQHELEQERAVESAQVQAAASEGEGAEASRESGKARPSRASRARSSAEP